MQEPSLGSQSLGFKHSTHLLVAVSHFGFSEFSLEHVSSFEVHSTQVPSSQAGFSSGQNKCGGDPGSKFNESALKFNESALKNLLLNLTNLPLKI